MMSDMRAALACGWGALSLAMVGVAYAGQGHAIFQKDPRTGRIPWHRKLPLGPYLAITWLFWHIVRLASRARPFAELAPGLFIGRRLGPREYPDGIKTIVDLTHEFDELQPCDQTPRYVSLPILDGAALRPHALKRIATQVAAMDRPVYLHCAMGHGRTAMIAASVLMTEQLALSPHDALTLVAEVRKDARPNGAQLAALAGLHELLR